MDIPSTQAFYDDEEIEISQITEPEDLQVGLLIFKNGNSHPIKRGTNIVGRLPTCDIILQDETISKKHAEIEVEGKLRSVFVSDLESSNKTKLNNCPMKPRCMYAIQPGDEITFGRLTATYQPTLSKVTNQEEIVIQSNSSIMEDSFIPGTQETPIKKPVFQLPKVPRRSTNFNNMETLPFVTDVETTIADMETQEYNEKSLIIEESPDENDSSNDSHVSNSNYSWKNINKSKKQDRSDSPNLLGQFFDNLEPEKTEFFDMPTQNNEKSANGFFDMPTQSITEPDKPQEKSTSSIFDMQTQAIEKEATTTVEDDLKTMFENSTEEVDDELTQLSTQNLTNILESTQMEKPKSKKRKLSPVGDQLTTPKKCSPRNKRINVEVTPPEKLRSGRRIESPLPNELEVEEDLVPTKTPPEKLKSRRRIDSPFSHELGVEEDLVETKPAPKKLRSSPEKKTKDVNVEEELVPPLKKLKSRRRIDSPIPHDLEVEEELVPTKTPLKKLKSRRRIDSPFPNDLEVVETKPAPKKLRSSSEKKTKDVEVGEELVATKPALKKLKSRRIDSPLPNDMEVEEDSVETKPAPKRLRSSPAKKTKDVEVEEELVATKPALKKLRSSPEKKTKEVEVDEDLVPTKTPLKKLRSSLEKKTKEVEEDLVPTKTPLKKLRSRRTIDDEESSINSDDFPAVKILGTLSNPSKRGGRKILEISKETDSIKRGRGKKQLEITKRKRGGRNDSDEDLKKITDRLLSTETSPRRSTRTSKNNETPKKMLGLRLTKVDAQVGEESQEVERIMKNAKIIVSPAKTSGKIKHRILFTGLKEDSLCKIVKKLGGSLVEDPAKCTILVTDKIRRTLKFLCAIANSVPIVSIEWLHDSNKSTQFLDWNNYILKDPAMEAKFGFRLKKSLQLAKCKKLLQGFTILLGSDVTTPPITELKSMIVSSGGTTLVRAPSKWTNTIIVVSQNPTIKTTKLLSKAPKTVKIYSPELILTGILRQELDFEKNKF